MVQLSSVNAIEITDVNNDNKADLITGGNLFTFPPQFGRLDASYGHVLLMNGTGEVGLDRAEAIGFEPAGRDKGHKGNKGER